MENLTIELETGGDCQAGYQAMVAWLSASTSFGDKENESVPAFLGRLQALTMGRFLQCCEIC